MPINLASPGIVVREVDLTAEEITQREAEEAEALANPPKTIEELEEIKTQNELNFEFRIVREVTEREECIDKILGTNLEQGAELQNGLLVDLVVGVVKNQVTESVKTSEYDLYLLQLEEKNIENLNLIETPSFG